MLVQWGLNGDEDEDDVADNDDGGLLFISSRRYRNIKEYNGVV